MKTRPEQLAALLAEPEAIVAPLAQRLTVFEQLVRKWNPTINVVAKSTLPEIWERHILDSVQIFRFCPEKGLWLDLGSGGGFPGLVVAILAQVLRPDMRVRMVESDQRKAVFLRECGRQLGLSIDVLVDRIERLEPQAAAVVSARALAPLTELCAFADRHMAEDGVSVFLKGQQSEAEIVEAGRFWLFDLERHASITSGDASILTVRRLRHA